MTQRTPRRLVNRRLLLILLFAVLLGSLSPAAGAAQAQVEPPTQPPDAGAQRNAARQRQIEELRQELLDELDLMQPTFDSGINETSGAAAFTDCSAVVDVPQSECEALVEVYNTTGGPNWTYNQRWLETNVVCSWINVTCDANLNVVQLVLIGNVTGKMPPAVGNLSELLWLQMYSDPGFVPGPIPEEYANLTKLQYLILYNTDRTGPMPAWIGELSQLKQLFLAGNPGFDAGPIPEEYAELSNLNDLFLYSTNRTGTMPAWLAQLPKLEGLDLGDNPGFQSGPIPDEYASITNLKTLDVGNTNRAGEIPVWIGDRADLEILRLQDNQLTGTIPAELGNLTSIYDFNLSGNALEGDIPTSITQVGSNPTFPPWWYFDVGYNMLTASDPAVVSFLNASDPDWAETQTVPPADLQVQQGSANTATLTWSPIPYVANGGFYEVSYATSQDGPWTVHGTTADKTVGNYTVGGLQPETGYYFRVRTHTPAFDSQPNDLWSPYSEVVAWTSPPNHFADMPVEGKEWMQPWVESFYLDGITTGCLPEPLSYCPEREVTRAEMAVFILRALNYPDLPYTPIGGTGSFADMPITGKEWMEPWVEEFYGLGITTGCLPAPLSYCPERQVTRAEMAVFVLRARYGGDYQPPAASGTFADVPVQGKEWMEPWIEQFYAEGITTGCGTGTDGRPNFCPERQVTRAEMAVFLLRAFDNLPSPE